MNHYFGGMHVDWLIVQLPIRQCNEGGWEFSMDDDGTNVILEVGTYKVRHQSYAYTVYCVQVELQRHLDMSLIDIDVQPNHVAVVSAPLFLAFYSVDYLISVDTLLHNR